MAEVPHRGAPTIKKSGFFTGEDCLSEKISAFSFIIRGPVFELLAGSGKRATRLRETIRTSNLPRAATEDSGKRQIPGFSNSNRAMEFWNGPPFKPDLLSKYAGEQSRFAGARLMNLRIIQPAGTGSCGERSWI
jgi:hypothetical protein